MLLDLIVGDVEAGLIEIPIAESSISFHRNSIHARNFVSAVGTVTLILPKLFNIHWLANGTVPSVEIALGIFMTDDRTGKSSPVVYSWRVDALEPAR